MEHREYIAFKIKQDHDNEMKEQYKKEKQSCYLTASTRLKDYDARKSAYNEHIAPLLFEAAMVILSCKDNTISDLGNYFQQWDCKRYIKNIISLNLVLPMTLLSLSKEDAEKHVDELLYEAFSKMMNEDYRISQENIEQDKFADEHFVPKYSDRLFVRFMRECISRPQEPIELQTEPIKKRRKNAK